MLYLLYFHMFNFVDLSGNKTQFFWCVFSCKQCTDRAGTYCSWAGSDQSCIYSCAVSQWWWRYLQRSV